MAIEIAVERNDAEGPDNTSTLQQYMALSAKAGLPSLMEDCQLNWIQVFAWMTFFVIYGTISLERMNCPNCATVCLHNIESGSYTCGSKAQDLLMLLSLEWSKLQGTQVDLCVRVCWT
jgi:hypothetical protein